MIGLAALRLEPGNRMALPPDRIRQGLVPATTRLDRGDAPDLVAVTAGRFRLTDTVARGGTVAASRFPALPVRRDTRFPFDPPAPAPEA
ncbi:hypothetical protein [Methylobacterium sp. Leaf118]|uniref:hypothetical protein n=1 Tax=Methylobacterium sp. Leaf118 TaxID=2876562 RepID=UPI001E5D3095|nr:hypothetical protein [Methylobacterium sp. Leaf118]